MKVSARMSCCLGEDQDGRWRLWVWYRAHALVSIPTGWLRWLLIPAVLAVLIGEGLRWRDAFEDFVRGLQFWSGA